MQKKNTPHSILFFTFHGCRYTCTQKIKRTIHLSLFYIHLWDIIQLLTFISIRGHFGYSHCRKINRLVFVLLRPHILVFEFCIPIQQTLITVCISPKIMKTSRPGNAFRITSPLKGEATGHSQKGPVMIMFSLLLAWTSRWPNRGVAPDFRCHDAHVPSL